MTAKQTQTEAEMQKAQLDEIAKKFAVKLLRMPPGIDPGIVFSMYYGWMRGATAALGSNSVTRTAAALLHSRFRTELALMHGKKYEEKVLMLRKWYSQ